MTKNTLVDLNNHLFAEMERLGDEDLKGEKLEEELARARGIASVGTQIILNAKTMLDAAKFQDNMMDADGTTPKKLLGE